MARPFPPQLLTEIRRLGYDEGLTITEIAQRLNYSVSYVSLLARKHNIFPFRDHYGKARRRVALASMGQDRIRVVVQVYQHGKPTRTLNDATPAQLEDLAKFLRELYGLAQKMLDANATAFATAYPQVPAATEPQPHIEGEAPIDHAATVATPEPQPLDAPLDHDTAAMEAAEAGAPRE